MAEEIKVGDKAPDFTLKNQHNEDVTLSGLLQQSDVVLAFYPLDFSPVCSNECASFAADLDKFKAIGAQVVGISVDSVWCHKAFAEKMGISFPLLADFNPKGAVASQYGLYLDDLGITKRATVVVGRDGTVKYVRVQELKQARSNEEILRALSAA